MFVWGLVLLLAAILAWFGLAVLHRRVVTARLARICRQQRAIVLTYDDGPSTGVTLTLANLLAEHEAKATFFVIGGFAEMHPGLVVRLQAEGHEIGSHTQSHSNAWKTTPWGAMRDLVAGQQTLARLGLQTRMFRPPYGKTTLGTLIAGWEQHFAFWTIDPQDSWDRRPVADILAEIDQKGGGVVLMHDFDLPRRGPAPAAHPAYLLELTEALIGHAAIGGYRILRFGDLLEHDAEKGKPVSRANHAITKNPPQTGAVA